MMAPPCCTLCVGLLLSSQALFPARLVATRETGGVAGRVLTAEGKPAVDATVWFANLGRRTSVGQDGSFCVDGVPAGEQLVIATSLRYGGAEATLSIRAETTVTVEIKLAQGFHDELVVSASPEIRTLAEVYQPVAVLSGQELQARVQPSLGQTIAQEPGVASSYFGPSVGRPILRGLGGDRVRLLDNGTDVGDLSVGGPDHAVAAATMLADRIEVLRGPATLLYGSSAEGGAVNVIDDRIPQSLPGAAATGHLELGAGTVADEINGAFSAEGRVGQHLAWYAGALDRRTTDYGIPGFASIPSARGPDETPSKLKNSSSENKVGTMGVSYVDALGYFGAAVSRTEEVYGLPGQLGAEASSRSAPKIDLHLDRLDLRGEIRQPFGIVRDLKLQFTTNQYQHVEAEGSRAFGTLNSQDIWEGRLEMLHRSLGPVSGSLGLQIRHRDFSSVGTEVFIAPNKTENFALVDLEEVELGGTRWQAGLRYEHERIGGASEAAPERSYGGLSGSLGVVWKAGPGYSMAASLTRATKFPSAEELYTDGAHLATLSFEVGNPDLAKESNALLFVCSSSAFAGCSGSAWRRLSPRPQVARSSPSASTKPSTSRRSSGSSLTSSSSTSKAAATSGSRRSARSATGSLASRCLHMGWGARRKRFCSALKRERSVTWSNRPRWRISSRPSSSPPEGKWWRLRRRRPQCSLASPSCRCCAGKWTLSTRWS